jgi:hypothetical protein
MELQLSAMVEVLLLQWLCKSLTEWISSFDALKCVLIPLDEHYVIVTKQHFGHSAVNFFFFFLLLKSRSVQSHDRSISPGSFSLHGNEELFITYVGMCLFRSRFSIFSVSFFALPQAANYLWRVVPFKTSLSPEVITLILAPDLSGAEPEECHNKRHPLSLPVKIYVFLATFPKSNAAKLQYQNLTTC